VHRQASLPLVILIAFGASRTAHAITCEEVLALLDSGATEATVLDALRSQPPLSQDDVRCLQKAGASRSILNAVGAAPLPAGTDLAGAAALGSDKATWGRFAANTAVTGAGLALAGMAAYNFSQAGRAYDDYDAFVAAADEAAANRVYDVEVKPRMIVADVEAATALALLGAGTLLWLTDVNAEALKDGPAWQRFLINTAVTGAGAGLGGAAIFNFRQARSAYLDYQEAATTDAGDAILADEVRPRQTLAIGEGVAAAALLAGGGILWWSSDRVSLQAGPTAVSWNYNW